MENPPSHRHRLLQGAGGFVALVVLYAASFGPFCYVWVRYWNEEPRIMFVYEPLLRLSHRSPTAFKLLDGYSWWFYNLGERHRSEAEKKPPE